MSEKFQKKPLALSIGAVVVTSLSASPIVNAETNPFGLTELSSGYMQIAEGMKCGAAKCGGKKGEKQGNCAGKKDAKGADAKCGEGKCAAGKCAGKKDAKDAGTKDVDAKCGAGKCAAGKCAANIDGETADEAEKSESEDTSSGE